MHPEAFEALVEEEFPNAVPEKFRSMIKNLAFIVEDEPSAEVRKAEGLGPDETLLGLYHGIPAVERGDWYGVGMTMPDTITLYQLPIEAEADFLAEDDFRNNVKNRYDYYLRKVIRETIWHEVAHHFGYDEHQVREREAERGEEK